MAQYRELEGGLIDQNSLWTTGALCPLTNEGFKSQFCPKRDKCELPEIGVRAQSGDEAREFADYAIATGAMPKCDNGKPFSLKISGTIPVRFYLAVGPGIEYTF